MSLQNPPFWRDKATVSLKNPPIWSDEATQSHSISIFQSMKRLYRFKICHFEAMKRLFSFKIRHFEAMKRLCRFKIRLLGAMKRLCRFNNSRKDRPIQSEDRCRYRRIGQSDLRPPLYRSHGQNLRLTPGQAEPFAQYFFKKSTTENKLKCPRWLLVSFLAARGSDKIILHME